MTAFDMSFVHQLNLKEIELLEGMLKQAKEALIANDATSTSDVSTNDTATSTNVEADDADTGFNKESNSLTFMVKRDFKKARSDAHNQRKTYRKPKENSKLEENRNDQNHSKKKHEDRVYTDSRRSKIAQKIYYAKYGMRDTQSADVRQQLKEDCFVHVDSNDYFVCDCHANDDPDDHTCAIGIKEPHLGLFVGISHPHAKERQVTEGGMFLGSVENPVYIVHLASLSKNKAHEELIKRV